MRFLVLAALAGCYGPRTPQGAPCVDDDHCPAPQRCAADGFCSLFDAAPDALARFAPSNGIPAARADAVAIDVVFAAGTSTLDTTTGAITGATTRAAGTGVIADIDFAVIDGLGVFVFHRLAVPAAATLALTGTNPGVLLVGTTATIDGAIDGSAGCAGGGDPSCPGPGGGTGGRDLAMPPTGCGAGGIGAAATNGTRDDGGGGGGGGGGNGGNGGTPPTAPGGAGGAACLAQDLQPLAGGSGGGISLEGAALRFGHGGGGGGALQLSALDGVTIAGTIAMNGAGGEGAQPNTGGDAGGGSGGGAGGGILVEGPTVVLGPAAILAANGGGGGGGGAGNSGGTAGQPGSLGTLAAAGGAGAGAAGDGGAGGALSPAAPGVSIAPNGGGGGGGAGRIVLRAHSPSPGGKLSPAPILVAVP